MDSFKIVKLMVFELVKKFTAFYGTRTITAILTKFLHSSLSKSVPTLLSWLFKIHFNIIIPLWMIMIMWKLWTQVRVPLNASSHTALCVSGWYLHSCVEDPTFNLVPIKGLELGCGCFLSDPFQFVIHKSSSHLVVCIWGIESVG